MKNLFLSIIIVIMFFATACEKALLETGTSNDPEANFEALWKGYNDHYGLFEVKGIDWDSVYAANIVKVHPETTNKELAAIFKSMLSPLNDIHSFIIPVNDPELSNRIESSSLFDTMLIQTDYKASVVEANYVSDLKKQGEFIEYGWLPNNVGYIHITAMEGSLKFIETAMNTILSELENANGIVIDIRNNSGGDDRISKYIAGSFAAESKLFMKTRKKIGPEKSEFTDWQEWHLQPEGEKTYTKPVVLLTSRWSQSAAETFALAMRVNSNVTIIGDHTAGGFSDVVAKELPNGWLYFVSVGDYRAADGNSYESKGVPPEVLLVNSKADLAAGKDKVLEYAIEQLK